MMKDKRVIIGGLVGGIAILVFAFSILTVINSIFPAMAGGDNMWIELIPVVLAPVAGGFLSGLIGKNNPSRAGLIAGVLASLVIFVGWVIYAGLQFNTILRGIVIAFLWVILARVMAGFAQPRKKA
jgi:hypothetical protein